MMIAVPVAAPLRKNDGNEGSKEEMESFFNGGGADDFSDFTAGDLLDAIDFDDLLLGINDEYVLPDLELDQQDLLSEFSTSCGEEYSDAAKLVEKFQEEDAQTTKDDDDKLSGSGSDLISSGGGRGDEIVNKAGKKEGHHKRKRSSSSSALDKNTNALKGKKKVKVDWTPELHKRFVQAVEQLGVDKAVPSRILEIMGIDCLTRHNIASHLQKYRSHRKHLLAREAEAANWTQRRQIYSPATAGGGGKMNINPWLAPTIGFPQMAPPSVQHNVRPFHVWGHPPVEQSPAHMWPKHLAHPPPLIAPPRPPMWAHPPPHTTPHIDSSYWYPPPGHHTVPGGFTQGTPCFQAPLATARFPAPHVPAVPTHPMYKAEPRMSSVPAERSGSHSPLDLHPSSESIDAAIGDVLSKSWLPLPIGLKPPSLDSVMGELERQGVPKIPPTCAASDSSSIS